VEISNTLKYINLTGLALRLVALRGPMHRRACVSETRRDEEGAVSRPPSDILELQHLTFFLVA
jgi:hypothetical protein